MSIAIKKENIKSPSRRSWLLIALSITAVLALSVAILVGSTVWLLNVGTRTSVRPSTQSIVDAEAPVSSEHRIAAQSITQQYMTALLKGQYNIMWSLLHPQVQALWPGETAFAKYWRVRFQDYTLQGFVLGKVYGLRQWTDPETMITYHQVVVFAVSLQLTPKPVVQQLTDAPPEDLHPSTVFQDLPFVLQQDINQNDQQTSWRVLQGGPGDLEAPILPPIHPAPTIVQVPILMYHHISAAPTTNLLDWSLTVTPAHFAQQLDYLKQRGYHTITFNQLFDALYYGGPLRPHPIILTFDDGYEDVYKFAFPLLQAHGYSGMFYIITGVVGWKNYMSWPELHALINGGMQIGSHTIHHVDIGSTLLYSPQRAQQELQLSQATLERNLGIVVQQFCYPSGEPFRHGSLALRQLIVVLLAADGYVGATTDPGMTGIEQQSAAPFVLLRIRVDGREPFLAFTQSLP